MSRTAEKAVREFDPRHRVVGAIVLFALAVIFVPMILDNPSATDAQSGSVIKIPEKDKKIFVSKIAPVDANDKQKRDALSTAPVAKTPTRASKQASVDKSSARAGAGKHTPAGQSWAVRIGTFTKTENAQRIMTMLQQKGFDPKKGRVKTATGRATRVWLGPFRDREEAAKTHKRILKETGQKGWIVAYP